MIDRQIRRIVIDTNVFVSGFLRKGSIPAQAILKAERECDLLASEAVLTEMALVFRKRKFDKRIPWSEREAALLHIQEIAIIIEIDKTIHACRDPRDDKFLEVAVYGRADLILTGDADLLALHPYQGIAILTPAEFLTDEAGAAPTGILKSR
jgi:putative PIN family toxin of toxin-antitoxin system